MSKFSFDVLKRCVFPFTDTHDEDVLLRAAFGEDVPLTKVGEDIFASPIDPIVDAAGNIGRLAVHGACNDIAARGIRRAGSSGWCWSSRLTKRSGSQEAVTMKALMTCTRPS